jgi:D-glycero-alpha-D-manno-heptose-7-phosphate kinase
MVVSRAPVRISFGGGGTDLEAYYARFGGFVLSAAISHYCYVAATQPTDGGVSIHSLTSAYDSSEREQAGEEETLTRLTDAAMSLLGSDDLRRRGVSLTFACDVPPGTGLGTSSATAVALLHALTTYLNRRTDAATLANQACELEIERLGMPIGKQDQYCSAFGGLNGIAFASDGVDVVPLPLPECTRRALHTRLLLFSTGQRHNSSAILRQQREDTHTKQATVEHLHQLKALAQVMCDLLLAGELDEFGRLLDLAWHEKRQLSAAISNTSIDSWYFAARTAGALGGKITGAGGGGYLLLYAPPERVRLVRAVMEEAGLHELPFDFATRGAGSLACLPRRHRSRLWQGDTSPERRRHLETTQPTAG